ncbi:MAG: NADH:ubiquinone reductase (Na(+)-transporting) subunit D [Planctomycetes bacterium]|nr:NADH:ubiquinone reductase (Na(+)-transporting) subunit D [Planctomycetota bacterium]
MKFTKSKVFKQLSIPMLQENPIMFLVLGVCSALAVTVQMKNALVMSVALTVVLIASNVVISLIRNLIPGKIRIIVYLCVIATMVGVVDLILKAYVFEVSKQLSVFVGLIVTNCIVMGRAEAFAVANPPIPSFWDGLGNGLGYSAVLIAVAFCRELFGSGKFFGIQVIPASVYGAGYLDNGMMLLPPGAFFVIGLIIWMSSIYVHRKRG